MKSKRELSLKKRLQKEIKLLGQRRDSLRDVIYDFEDLASKCEEAISDLNRAVDNLSESV